MRRVGLPSGRLPYNNKLWWDERYSESQNAVSEWGNLGYSALRAHTGCREIESYLPLQLQGKLRESSLGDDDLAGLALKSGGRLLMLGGGTSRLSRDMAQDGWRDVLDIDFSSEVVESQQKQQQEQALVVAAAATAASLTSEGEEEGQDDDEEGSSSSSQQHLRFAVADARTMRPNDAELGGKPFDVCLDKGLVDALWCSGGDVSEIDIPLVSASVAATLTPGGRFLALSYTSPRDLQPLLQGQPGSTLSGLWAGCEVRN
jgi:hypothetical protein